MQQLRNRPAGRPAAEAFACVYEAFRRVMGITIHPAQLEGALAMAKGKIAQLQTGEPRNRLAQLQETLGAMQAVIAEGLGQS